MKRFFIISVLTLFVMPYAMACGGGWPTYNYYMFSVLDYEYNPVDTNTDRFWNTYSNGAVTEFDAEALMDIAKRRGDKETQNYLTLLQDYLEACGANDNPWDYPSKEEKAQREKNLNKILNATKLYKGTRYKEHYALLQMRANRALKRYNDNISFWQKTGSAFAASPYRNRMEGIYAGALLKTGKRNEACNIYASLGDEESIKWVARHYCNLAGIKSFYEKNPNSPMLPYLVQRFVNNAQETLDTKKEYGNDNYGEWLEMLQVLPTEANDVKEFIAFAEKAAENPKVETPCLYLSAAGFLCYLYGEQQRAENYLTRAQDANGTDIQHDNLRALRLLVSTGGKHEADSYDNYVLQELQWLKKKIKETEKPTDDDDYYSNNHYTDVLLRVVYTGLIPYYDKNGQGNTAIALLRMVNLTNKDSEEPEPYKFGDYYSQRLDSLKADEAVAYYGMLKRGGDSGLQTWAVSQVKVDDNYFNDIIGTKMLREERWEEAISYLKKVPLKYLNDQGIAAYAKYKDYNKPRGMGRQNMPKGINWENPGLTANVKVKFCETMQKNLKDYKKASGEKKYSLAYRLATLYYQASYLGDSWYLTQYGQSISDQQLSYAHDFVMEALKYLEVAKNSSDKSLRIEALYARAFIPRDKWFVNGYDEKTYDPYYVLQPQSRQFKALQDLSEAAKQGAPSYVTHCDVLRIFRNEIANGTGGQRSTEQNKYFSPW